MISPPTKSDLIGEPMPSVREQWGRTPIRTRTVVVAVPVLVVLVVLAVNATAAASLAVLLFGAALVTAVFVKNRSDRYNAAIGSGEIRPLFDHNLRPAGADDLPADVRAGLGYWGVGPDQFGRVARFDGGWLVTNRNPRDVAVVAGDDGGWARFDPRRVPDAWAASEYLAGRGRELGSRS